MVEGHEGAGATDGAGDGGAVGVLDGIDDKEGFGDADGDKEGSGDAVGVSEIPQ